MPTFRQEIQDLIDEITGANHAGESWEDRAEHIAAEAFDVLGKLVTSFNDENRAADMAELQAELEAAAAVIVTKLLVDRPVIARTLKASLPFIVGPALEQAANYAGGFVAFGEQQIAPRLGRIERVAHRGRVAFGG